MGFWKFFEFKLDPEKEFFKKLKLTLGVLFINCIMVLTIIALAYWWYEKAHINIIIETIKLSNMSFFSQFNVSNFSVIFLYSSLQQAILQENLFRYPILFLIKKNFKLRIKYNLERPLLLILALALNYTWSVGLVVNGLVVLTNHPMPLPVFLSGLLLYWLVIKTRSIWPSIVCHASSNLLLYFFAQLLIYLGYISQVAF